MRFDIHKDIFACLFSTHNAISLSCHEQVSLSGLLNTEQTSKNMFMYKVDQFPNFEKFQKLALFFLFLCQNFLYDSESY